MMLKAFALLDTKTGAYGVPFFMAHVGQAVRACMDLGQDMNTTVGRHPADYALVEVGTFDDATGRLEAIAFEHHGTVLGFLPRPQALPLEAEQLRQVPIRMNGGVGPATRDQVQDVAEGVR